MHVLWHQVDVGARGREAEARDEERVDVSRWKDELVTRLMFRVALELVVDEGQQWTIMVVKSG